MRWLLLGLALALSACALHPPRSAAHPVQPAPRDWTPPLALRHCVVQEQITWPNGRVTVSMDCPGDALLLVDKRTGAIVERVTWEEIRFGSTRK